MGKSPKTKVRHEGRPSLQPQQGNGGRGTETTTPGSSVVSDVKGGTGDRDCDGDPEQSRRGSFPPA
jgi:hypothetical protein